MARKRLVLALVALCAVAGVLGIRQASGGPFRRLVAMPGDPVAIAVDGRTHRAFVLDGADYTVGVLDTVSGDQVASSRVGTGALSLAVVERSNRVFVLNSGDDTVSVLDARSGSVVGTTTLGFSPQLVAVDSSTGRVYVTSAPGSDLAILNGSTGGILHMISLDRAPVYLAIDGAARQILLANGDHTLEARDAVTGRLLRTVAISGYPSGLGVDEQTNHLFVADPLHDTVSMLDARTLAVLRVSPVPESPIALIMMHSPGIAIVASLASVPGATSSSGLSVLDAGTGRRLRTIPISQGLQALLGDEQSREVFVDVGSAVLEIDVRTGAEIRSLPVLGGRVNTGGMAVDEGAGHLFVVNTDNSNAGTVSPTLDWLSRWIPWLQPKSAAPYGSINEYGVGQ